MVSCLLAVVRAPRVWKILSTLVQCFPIRSALLAVNLCIGALVILYFVDKFWGMLLILSVISVALLAMLSGCSNARKRIATQVVCCSPMTFLAVYFLWSVGEVYLRFNPRLLGRGGAGPGPAIEQLYGHLYSYNSLGLREREISHTRPAGVFRILTLGDSFTFGQGVPFDETYTKQVESRLNAAGSGPRYEVINAGKCGQSTIEELHYLREEGLKLQPNLILLQFYANDIQYHDPDSATDRIYQKLMRPLSCSYALYFVAERLSGLERAQSPLGQWAKTVRERGRGWRVCESAMKELAKLSKSNAIPAVVILFPRPTEDGDDTRFIHQAVADVCREAGLGVVDLSGAFADIAASDRVVSEVDHHPSPKVHNRVGERLYDTLKEMGVLRGAGDGRTGLGEQ